ncbi:LysE family translocator [Parahaliea maris]|uniref:LysE family translocator n=1 Tax=Parahaliea maris TaxID=2716870 RepID=A0A5C8ZYQ8_9GAMM|nr:LysE family translocator [Parahaliea maris]TXS92742.1 LysE family translocator [Parahaliea maris]
MEFSHWLSLFTVCLLGAISPGPSLAVVLGNTLRQGRAAGLAAAFAHGFGVGLYGLITVSGLALVMTGSPRAFAAIQMAGAGYLIYLGVRGLRSSHSGASAGLSEGGGESSRGSALSGFLVAFLNPKLAVFMLALFSQFLGPGTDWTVKGIMVLTVGLTDAGWYALVAAMASHPQAIDWLRQREQLIDRVLALVLLTLGTVVLARALMALGG